MVEHKRLNPVPVVNGLEPGEFARDWRANRTPVVIRDYTRSWPAKNRWNLQFLQSAIGRTRVSLYQNSMNNPSAAVNAPAMQMAFTDYIDILLHEETDLRVFLLNLKKVAPELVDDIGPPPSQTGWLRKFPMLFIGKANSRVFMHYDIDMSHVFHSQFGGDKTAVLFPPDCSSTIYQIPMSVRCIMDLDPESPDYETFPALSQARGFKTTLRHGDTLYIPPGWWHHMHYIDNGFGLSQRCLSRDPRLLAKAMWNIFGVKTVESLFRKVAGARWANWKTRIAMNRGERYPSQ